VLRTASTVEEGDGCGLDGVPQRPSGGPRQGGADLGGGALIEIVTPVKS